jgi:hypothetical protein
MHFSLSYQMLNGGTLINAGVKGYGYYFCHNSVFTKAILALKGGK